jgi:hypothetical protein
LLKRFYENVLDEKPFLVSDEANIFDVSDPEPEELVARIFRSYGMTLSMAGLKPPCGS